MGSIDPVRKERWLQELELNGFIILRDFLPVELVTEMHEQLLPILNGEYKKAEADGFARGRGRGRLALDMAVYGKLLGGALADERYRRHPVIEELVDAVFGGPGTWERGWTNVEAVWKGSDYMSWHPDSTPEDAPDPSAPHEIVRLTYNIALVDFTWANGTMEILPGSHHLRRAFLERGSILDIPNIHPVALDLRRGDAVLRDGNGLHRGTPNLTDRPRPMLDQTYKRKKRP